MEQSRNILAQSTFNLLKGQWKIGRRIEGYGRMEGVASFSNAVPSLLSYCEDGVHELNHGETVGFYQNYLYRYHDDELSVRFPDGRPFHTLNFDWSGNELKAYALHLCGADTYRGTYLFHDNDHFSLIWDVMGPKKNYMIETHYKRQATC